MKRLIVGIVSVLFVLASVACGQDITYQLVNYPADQNGWTLSGSVTTDGTIGDISPGGARVAVSQSILSWSYTATQGDVSYACSSLGSSGNIHAFAEILGTLTATPTQLILTSGTNSLELTSPASVPTPSGIYWNNDKLYSCFFSTGTGPNKGWTTGQPQMNGSSDWIIADNGTPVPEPSTLILLGIGAMGVVACCNRRNSRCKSA